MVISRKLNPIAKGIGTTPEAIGRNFLKGCNLSLSTSKTSFSRYIAEAARQKIKKALIVVRR